MIELIENPKTGEQIQSSFTDETARAAIGKQSNEFAQTLASKPWSPVMRFWAHKLAMEALSPAFSVPFGGFCLVNDLFASAFKSNLKRPKMTILINGLSITLSVAGQKAKSPGSINVVLGDRWIGRITPDNDWEGVKPMEATKVALTAILEDPVGVSMASGKKSGCCCFCNKGLETKESLSVGYGPVCSKKWGLPWGLAVIA